MQTNKLQILNLRNFGFSLQWACVCVSLYSILLGSNSADPMYYMELVTLIQPSASAMCLLILAISFRHSRIGPNEPARYLSIIGGFLGTIMMYVASGIDATWGVVLFIVGAIFTSVVNSILLIMWSEYYSNNSIQKAMKYVSTSIAVGTVITFGIVALPNVIAIAITALLPGLSVLALPKTSKIIEQEPNEGAVSTKYPLPPALMVGLVIYGVAFGLMPGLFFGDQETFLITSRAGLIFIGITVLIVAILSYILPKKFRFDLVAKTVLPLLAAGFILLPVANGPLAYGLLKAGETMFDMVLWIILFDTAFRSGNYSPASIFSWGRFMAHTGRIIGVVLISTIISTFHIDNTLLGVIALVGVYVLILTNTFALDWKAFFERKGSSKNLPVEDATARFSAIQKRYSLTPREMEVLPLIAKGRSGPNIAKQLGIAESTVKTHTHHIYDKVGVATKQELLDIIDTIDISTP